MRLSVTILASVFATSALLAADRASLAGAVFDSAGRPVEHATVLVYHAGVKHGFSTFVQAVMLIAERGRSPVRMETSLSGM